MASLGVAIVREYQRGVVFRFGRIRNVRAPGLRFMIPLVDRMQKVTLRTVTKPIQSQQIITKDNVSIGVAAVAYYRRVDPVKSIVEIENVESAIDQIAQTTVRNVVGRSSLDQVLSQTESLNQSIKNILDVTSERWGVLVVMVELKDIELPESMKRAMAREAEAEREKRAKIIAAEGEALSAGKLAEAADVISEHPIALQLRNLQVLGEIAIERNSTIVFPAQFLDSVREIARFVGAERAVEPRPHAVAPPETPGGARDG
jgi:regulator of protease activity HflC (stomatin/prohibitin superfamily)